ncbi:MAG TPA: GNAT family N-acetyltransferase [Tepidisphaeraceae bacterium]
MEIRPGKQQDLDELREIDGTIESAQYLHLDAAGEGLDRSWSLQQRPLREKLIEPNRLDDEAYFVAKQILTGADEGTVLVAEHEEALVAALIAQPRHVNKTLHIVDVRIDYDQRRQGLGTAMIFQMIQRARESEMRAVSMETLTNNVPAGALLAKCGFELSGVDTRRRSNHDVVKEAATLFWYAALD